MNLINISKTEEQLNPAGFEIVNETNYPICLVGFRLRNEYDRLRLKINEKYNPRDIVHLIHFPEPDTFFYRGIVVSLNQTAHKLISEIHRYIDNNIELTDTAYKQLLKRYNDLTCISCASSLAQGVYPIDSECLDHVTDDVIDLRELYCSVFKNVDVPYFQAVGYFTIYLLDSKNTANSTTSKTLKKIVDGYKNLSGIL